MSGDWVPKEWIWPGLPLGTREGTTATQSATLTVVLAPSQVRDLATAKPFMDPDEDWAQRIRAAETISEAVALVEALREEERERCREDERFEIIEDA